MSALLAQYDYCTLETYSSSSLSFRFFFLFFFCFVSSYITVIIIVTILFIIVRGGVNDLLSNFGGKVLLNRRCFLVDT